LWDHPDQIVLFFVGELKQRDIFPDLFAAGRGDLTSSQFDLKPSSSSITA
jgi:hypothetical protein